MFRYLMDIMSYNKEYLSDYVEKHTEDIVSSVVVVMTVSIILVLQKRRDRK